MCSRILAERDRASQDLDGEFSADSSNPILQFLRSFARLVSRPRLARGADRPGLRFGVWFFFSQLPFTLLPTGDSGTIRGFFIVQEGASPDQQRKLQEKLDPILQAESRGRQIFHRRRALPDWRRCLHRALPEGCERARPISRTVAARACAKRCSDIPGIFPTLNPPPVLQINIGATGSQFGRYSYVIQRDQSGRSLRCGR